MDGLSSQHARPIYPEHSEYCPTRPTRPLTRIALHSVGRSCSVDHDDFDHPDGVGRIGAYIYIPPNFCAGIDEQRAFVGPHHACDHMQSSPYTRHTCMYILYMLHAVHVISPCSRHIRNSLPTRRHSCRIGAARVFMALCYRVAAFGIGLLGATYIHTYIPNPQWLLCGGKETFPRGTSPQRRGPLTRPGRYIRYGHSLRLSSYQHTQRPGSVGFFCAGIGLEAAMPGVHAVHITEYVHTTYEWRVILPN